MTDVDGVPDAPADRAAPGLLWWLAVVTCLFLLVVGTLATCGTVIIAQEAEPAPVVSRPVDGASGVSVPALPPPPAPAVSRTKTTTPEPLRLMLTHGEPTPVLGSWMLARIADEHGTLVHLEVAAGSATDVDGGLVDPWVDETVAVGIRLELQAWAMVAVTTASATEGLVFLEVTPMPVDADAPDGSLVVGFEPGSTKLDADVRVTVGQCVNSVVHVDVVRDGVVLHGGRVRPGDVIEPADWRTIEVLGVDPAYSGEGCRAVLALGPPPGAAPGVDG